MTKISSFLTFFIILLSISELQSQIKIRELNPDHSAQIQSILSSKSHKRAVINLDRDWSAYEEDKSDQKARVTIPNSYSGTDQLIYEREFRLSKKDLVENTITLNSLGVGNAAQFILNDNIIQNIRSGEIPSSVIIPEDLIYADAVNKLQVKVTYKLDKKTTIPLKSGFLSNRHTAGIFRSMYLELIPKEGFRNIRINQYRTNLAEARSFQLEYNAAESADSLEKTEINVQLFRNSSAPVFNEKIDITGQELGKAQFKFPNAEFWTPESPAYYRAVIQLLRNGNIVDDYIQNVAFYTLSNDGNHLRLNGNDYDLRGVNYDLSVPEKGYLVTYDQMRSKLGQIKSLGFNAVKFNHNAPHPLALDICLELGLFTILEIPINSMPEYFAEQNQFVQIASEYATNFVDKLANHTSVIGIGVGNGYLADSPIHLQFVSKLASEVKSKSTVLVYASFIGIPHEKPENLDLIGLDIYSRFQSDFEDQINRLSELVGSKRIFLSNLIYPAFVGSTNGYSNHNSFEAQAKFFEHSIEITNSQKLAGLFFGAMYDYSGEYQSLYAGHSENLIYRLGIMDENGKADRIAYKVIDSKFNNSEKVIIPLGAFKEESPVFFIIMSLVLSITLAVLINSKRKFREDASRALLRPYNFYADIRDNRILTGFHSITLIFILGAIHALLFTILLYFFRTNIFLEKILLAFGGEWLINIVSELAWNPVETFLKLYLFAMLLFVAISLLAKFASFFVKNRITFSSIFIVVIWSFLPVVILLPVELILYKVLAANLINPYIYAFILLFAVWLFQRLLKGLYVIYDVKASSVYFYGFLCLIIATGIYTLYHHYSNSAIYYVINAYKQYVLM